MVSAEAYGIDLSQSGIRVSSAERIPLGTSVYIEARGGTLVGYGIVRHCTPLRDAYAIGLEFTEGTKGKASPDEAEVDYYTFLQVNPKADWPTIQRIYRIMASRFHPDNPETGDAEKFLILQAAHETLSDPQRRTAYDASLQSREDGTLPIFELSEFVNGVEGEMNRRLGVLSLLYNRRRTSPHNPSISPFDLAKRMGMPREYLEFTTWYLKSKQYVTSGDNSDIALTVQGVDYVESNCSKNPIIQKLLDSGPVFVTSSTPSRNGDSARPGEKPLLPSPEGNGHMKPNGEPK